jgi:hypothetical protein
LDASGNQFVDPCTLSAEPTYNNLGTGESHCCWLQSLGPTLTTVLGMNVYGLSAHERATNIPVGCAGPSVADLAAPFTLPTRPSLATSSGPITPPQALHSRQDNCKWLWHLRSRLDCSPVRLDAPSYAAETLSYGTYEQPPAGPSSAGQCSRPIASVDEDDAQATDQFLLHPVSTGNKGE